MKKSSNIILFSFLFLSVFFTGNDVADAQFGGKTSLSSLIPTATMRDPQMEAKDLDSCFSGILNAVLDLVGGGGSGNSCSLDSIARIVGQQVAGTEFQSMMNMVGQGFFGDTAFLTDPESYFTGVNTEITDNFMNNFQSETTGIPPSSYTRIKQNILRQQNTPYQDILNSGPVFPGCEDGSNSACDAKIEAFSRDWNECKDSSGQKVNSWDCYRALEQPKYDPFTAERIVGENLVKEQREGLQQASNEVAQGNGFLTLKECSGDNHWVGCFATTPGSVLQEQTNTYLSSSLEQINQADELDETIIATAGGLFDAVTSWLGDRSLIKTTRAQPTAKTVYGLCGSYKNACVSGTLSDTEDSETQYLWTCQGSDPNNTTDDRKCALTFPASALCGSFNNSCTSGRLSDTNDSVISYLWDCVGSDGIIKNCSASKGVVGVCSTVKNSCISGLPVNTSQTIDDFLWDCIGSDNTVATDDAIGCSAPTPTACGSLYGTCVHGTLNILNDSVHWTCSNANLTLYCPKSI